MASTINTPYKMLPFQLQRDMSSAVKLLSKCVLGMAVYLEGCESSEDALCALEKDILKAREGLIRYIKMKEENCN